MYLSFFELQQEPFSIAPDPRFLYMSDKHREALALLNYGLNRGASFVLLTGEIGAGKAFYIVPIGHCVGSDGTVFAVDSSDLGLAI